MFRSRANAFPSNESQNHRISPVVWALRRRNYQKIVHVREKPDKSFITVMRRDKAVRNETVQSAINFLYGWMNVENDGTINSWKTLLEAKSPNVFITSSREWVLQRCQIYQPNKGLIKPQERRTSKKFQWKWNFWCTDNWISERLTLSVHKIW